MKSSYSPNGFLEQVRKITLSDLETGHDMDYLVRNLLLVFGEFAAALKDETGIQSKTQPPPSRQSSVDVVICALSLFFAQGGTVDEMVECGRIKLDVWERQVEKIKAETVNIFDNTSPLDGSTKSI